MKHWLDASGLFYYNGSIVSLVKKPDEVKRYLIYETLEPMREIKVTGKFFNFKEGEFLVVELKYEANRKRWNNADRVFFQFVGGTFVERKFKPIDIMEGELELARQLHIQYQKK